MRRWPLIAVLLLVLLIGAGLRLYQLPELPLGLHYDEAANGILAGEIASGHRTPVFIGAYTGKEVLFFYWAGLWMRLLGPSTLALRLSAAAVGLATVAATIWAVRELLYGRRDAVWIALLTGALLATSFWHLVLSRYGFRAITQPLLQALTVGGLWRGLRLSSASAGRAKGAEPRRAAGAAWLAAAGLLLGLTAYTYLAARAFPVPVAAGLVTLLIADRRHRRARLAQMAIFVGAAAVALAPLAYYWITHPGTFLNRTTQVAATTWAAVWEGLWAALGMLFVRGDPYIRFNIPHRPIFGPVMAVFFCLGLALLVFRSIRLARRIRRAPATPPADSGRPLHLAAYVFLLTCIPTMLLPSALAVGDVTPSNLRAVGLLPFVYVVPALALSALALAISRRWVKPLTTWLWVVPVLVLVIVGSATAVAYYRDWASSAALYYAADGDLVDVATYINQAGDLSGTTIYVASVHYRHPTLAFLAREYDDILWLTGGRTLVFPQDREALLIFPRSAAKDLSWVQSILPHDALVATRPGPDSRPAVHIYQVPPGFEPAPSVPLTADFAHTALLLGYDIVGEPTSGEKAEIAVWWRVQSKPEQGDLGPVARLADPWGSTWGETSPFHYPGEQWRPGDLVVDHLSIPVDLGAPPGDYQVRFSLYSAQAGSALPALAADGRYAGTWVELPVRLAPGDQADDVASALGIRNRLDTQIGDLALLGADIDTPAVRPGEPVRLTLFWQAGATKPPDHTVELILGDTMLYAGTPVHDTYPFSEWAPGQVVVDRYDPRLPLDAPPGEYGLTLRLTEPGTDSGVALDRALGSITVQAVERAFDVPTMSHRQAANLGGEVELLGYDLSADSAAPGDTIILTLYWRALVEMSENYTVFVHLLAPDGAVVGQHDGHPVGATYPTSLWMSGEVVVDVHEVLIRPDAPPGDHWLEVGMYVADTGTRLVNADSGEDSILLQQVAVGSP